MGNKKAHPINQMSFQYFVRYFAALNLTYLSAAGGWNWHLSSRRTNERLKGGCQGFIGPLPSAFLDKYSERTAAKIIAGCSYFKIFFKNEKQKCKAGGLVCSCANGMAGANAVIQPAKQRAATGDPQRATGCRSVAGQSFFTFYLPFAANDIIKLSIYSGCDGSKINWHYFRISNNN